MTDAVSVESSKSSRGASSILYKETTFTTWKQGLLWAQFSIQPVPLNVLYKELQVMQKYFCEK